MKYFFLKLCLLEIHTTCGSVPLVVAFSIVRKVMEKFVVCVLSSLTAGGVWVIFSKIPTIGRSSSV